MMVCVGPSVPAPSPASKSELPEEVKIHPVGTVEPVEYAPFEFTVNSIPLLEVSEPLVTPLLSVKKRSLTFCLILGSK
jgi:hypothetical protein